MPTAPTTAESTTPRREATVADSWTALAAWAADELGVRLAFDGKEYRFEPTDPTPPAESANRTDSTIRRSWFRRRAPKEEAPDTPADDFTCESPSDVVLELVERLNARDTPPMARPIKQPTAVHDFAHRLFEAYTLDGGRAHLAGCHLEDTPLVRLTTLDAEGETPSVSHRYYGELGEAIDAELAERLGLDRVAPTGDPAPRLDAGRFERMLGSARRQEDATPSLTTIVWAKRATGRLRFEFGDESVDTPFEGWAATLAAPPVICPQTGAETFHLATTEDGLIAAAEVIAACELTGARRLQSELVRCAVSGKRVAEELAQRCPVLQVHVLNDEMTACPRCDELVAKSALVGNGCRGCERVVRAPRQDARLAKLLGDYPSLAKMKPWRLGETENRLIAIGGGWTGRVLLVLDRETGELITAKRRGLFGPWRSTVIAATP